MYNQVVIKLISWDLLIEELNDNFPIEIKFHLHRIILKLQDFHKTTRETEKKKYVKKLKINTDWLDGYLLIIEACLDRTWEMLNCGFWRDVPIQYRYCYSLCSILKVLLLEISSRMICKVGDILEKLKQMIQQTDNGLILGAPLPSCPTLLTETASELNHYYLELMQSREASKSNTLVRTRKVHTNILYGFSAVTTYTKPSMEQFYRDIFKPKTPALLKDCLEHWKALSLWKDLEYLRRVAGCRTVPIEIGSGYTEEDWSQSLITISEFLDSYIIVKNSTTGYLAQHQLFDQIPELKEDFSIPEYCSFSDKEDDNEQPPDINAWFGPENTKSPLHHDPKNNLLCQVFGCKRVILYSPEDTANLYPHENRLLNNTAQVDPYAPDYVEFPNILKAKGLMCYLEPGDMLYIPPKWWHHVQGLTPSFSISFWWD